MAAHAKHMVWIEAVVRCESMGEMHRECILQLNQIKDRFRAVSSYMHVSGPWTAHLSLVLFAFF